jgi:hypothetical protein
MICHPGFYWMPQEERDKASRYLKEANGAVSATPSAERNRDRSKSLTSKHQGIEEVKK